jgi:hypothetical protein
MLTKLMLFGGERRVPENAWIYAAPKTNAR